MLYRALARRGGDAELRFMPPLGVQLVDAQAVSLFEEWIESLR